MLFAGYLDGWFDRNLSTSTVTKLLDWILVHLIAIVRPDYFEDWEYHTEEDSETWQNTKLNRSRKSVDFFLYLQKVGSLADFSEHYADIELGDAADDLRDDHSDKGDDAQSTASSGSSSGSSSASSSGGTRRLSFSNRNDILLFDC